METVPPRRRPANFATAGARSSKKAWLFSFRSEPGDPIKIGDLEFTVAGALRKMPGEASAAGSFAPRVYIPLQDLEETHLLKPGSLARYRAYVKFPENTDVEARMEMLGPQIKRLGMDYDTVAKRKRDLGSALENLYRFLNLVGFISLLLGAVGVASAIQAHLQQKTRTGAILRCLGMSSARDGFGLSRANRGDGPFRRGVRRRSRGGDATNFPAHSQIVPAAADLDFDRLAADLGGAFHRLRRLHSLRAPAAASFSAALAAAGFSRLGRSGARVTAARSSSLGGLRLDRRRHHRLFDFAD